MYRDDTDAYLELRLESLENSVAYLFEGSDRRNVTAFIQNNGTAVVGVPYRAPISAKLIVVMMTVPGGKIGAGSFSYEVYDSIEYPIWFKPFVGRD